jgi:hypothetical protein
VSEGVQKSKGKAEERAKQLTREWPEHYPKECPSCESHRPVDGPVFRLHRVPAAQMDALSYLQRGLPSPSSECVRAGLSCCITRADAESIRRIMRHMKDRKIAQADLSPDHGCIAQTGTPGHHSLWLRQAALSQYFTLFRVVE